MYLQKRLILARIIDNSVITCDEIIETTKIVHTKSVLTKKYFTKFLYFTYLFINYHCIIDSCLYLLLPDKS